MYYVLISPIKQTLSRIKQKYNVDFCADNFLIVKNVPDEVKNVSLLQIMPISDDEYQKIISKGENEFKQGMPIICVKGKYSGMIGIIRETIDPCIVELSTAGGMLIVNVPCDSIVPFEIKNPW